MRLFIVLAMTVISMLALAGPALGHSPNEKAVDNCNAAVGRQIEAGITAGGGPKAGEPGPLNCDHFYFFIGVIGNEHSGGH